MTRRYRLHAFFALIAGLAGLAGSFAVAGWTNDNLVLAVDAVVVSSTPASVVNWTIQTLGERGHVLHQALSIAIATGLFVATAACSLLAAERFGLPTAAGSAITVLVTTAVAYAATAALLPALVGGASAGLVVAVGEVVVAGRPDEPDRTDFGRRRVVGAVTGALAYAGVSLALGVRATRRARDVEAPRLPRQDVLDDMLASAAETDLGIDDVPPPVSPVGTFYSVDIASAPPELDADDWTLSVTGAVENEVEIDYDDLRDRPAEHRYVALRCIGDSLNGDQMDTAVWTGTPLSTVLEEANPQGQYVELHAADDYDTTFSREFLDDGMIAYGMNGDVLPREHGFPARILMPGSWGKLNAKWVEEIRFVEEPTEGYWERRGWESEAPIVTVAKLWTDPVNHLEDGRLEAGGHAYAGTRGIERVEVSTDGGDTWDEAELAEPLPGEDVTRQWRYRYEASEPHELVVRAVDGTGSVQERERSNSSPSGATGWVRTTVEP